MRRSLCNSRCSNTFTFSLSTLWTLCPVLALNHHKTSFKLKQGNLICFMITSSNTLWHINWSKKEIFTIGEANTLVFLFSCGHPTGDWGFNRPSRNSTTKSSILMLSSGTYALLDIEHFINIPSYTTIGWSEIASLAFDISSASGKDDMLDLGLQLFISSLPVYE